MTFDAYRSFVKGITMRIIFVFFLFFLGFGMVVGEEADKILCEKHYKIGNRGKSGSYSIKAVFRKTKKEFEIHEKIVVRHRGKDVDLNSCVIYQSQDPFSPKSGKTEIYLDGKLCMRGKVNFSEKFVHFQMTMFRDEKTGNPIVPKTFSDKRRKPSGFLLFQSALAIIGPKILPKEGSKKVVFVEFPDDIDSIINLKENFELVRNRANKAGEFELAVYRPFRRRIRRIRRIRKKPRNCGQIKRRQRRRPRRSLLQIQFSKENAILSMIRFGRKLLETKKEK